MKQAIMKQPPLMRQTNAKQPAVPAVVDIESQERFTELDNEETEPEAPPKDLQKESQKELDMFVNGHIMTKSTNMQSLNKQLQQCNNEIIEKQNMMTEIKTQMLQIQGSLKVLQEINQKMKDLKLCSESDNLSAMGAMMSA
jgi:hypothetical protein